MLKPAYIGSYFKCDNFTTSVGLGKKPTQRGHSHFIGRMSQHKVSSVHSVPFAPLAAISLFFQYFLPTEFIVLPLFRISQTN